MQASSASSRLEAEAIVAVVSNAMLRTPTPIKPDIILQYVAIEIELDRGPIAGGGTLT
jgi:hypothetical protein